MSEREDIEGYIAALLAPLKPATLKSVVSIGAQDYGNVLRAALAQAPFALIKYTGKAGGLDGGGECYDWQAEISVLIGCASEKSLAAKRLSIHTVLEAIEDRLVGKRLGSDDVYWPLVMAAEAWSEMAGGGLEVWEQRYSLRWQEKYSSITG